MILNKIEYPDNGTHLDRVLLLSLSLFSFSLCHDILPVGDLFGGFGVYYVLIS